MGSSTPTKVSFATKRLRFRFLALPAELRNMVYEYLVYGASDRQEIERDPVGRQRAVRAFSECSTGETKLIAGYLHFDYLFSPLTARHPKEQRYDSPTASIYQEYEHEAEWHSIPAICQVNKQIRAETLPLWQRDFNESLLLDLEPVYGSVPAWAPVQPADGLIRSGGMRPVKNQPDDGLLAAWLSTQPQHCLDNITKLHIANQFQIEKLTAPQWATGSFVSPCEMGDYRVILRIERRDNTLSIEAPCSGSAQWMQRAMQMLQITLRNRQIITGSEVLEVAAAFKMWMLAGKPFEMRIQKVECDRDEKGDYWLKYNAWHQVAALSLSEANTIDAAPTAQT